MASSAVDGLADVVRGQVVLPGSPGYDEARALYNAMIDKHPAGVVYCLDERDVAAVIGFARERGLRLAIRSGGHNGGGLGSVDEGLVLDLSPMHTVSVDAEASTVQVQGGAKLGEVDTATAMHGLVVPAGVISTTGIGGLTLGGGVGHLSRGFGLTIDNLSRRRSSWPTALWSRQTPSANRTSSGQSAAAAPTSVWSPPSRSGRGRCRARPGWPRFV